MEISIDSLIGILGLFVGGGGGAFFTWRWQRSKARAEAKSAEVDMAQKVQDTYQEMLEYKQKEVDDNHRLIDELRVDRDHYKSSYMEVRDSLEKLTREFRDFRNQSEEERVTMKRDIARNGRQLERLRPFLCYKRSCPCRVPVEISDGAGDEPTEDSNDIDPIDIKDL